MRHVMRPRLSWAAAISIGTLGAALICAPGCKRSNPSLLDDLRYFPRDIALIARVDFSKPGAGPAWQRAFAEFAGSDNGAAAIGALLEGCADGLLMGANTLTIGTRELSLASFDEFLWILRGSFSTSDLTKCLVHRAATSGADPAQLNLGGHLAFQYAPNRWASVAAEGVLMSGSVRSLQLALSQPTAASLAQSTEFLPVLKSWDGQDVWAAMVNPTRVTQLLASRSAWKPASESFSHAVLVGELSDKGLQVVVEGKLAKASEDAKAALRDFAGLIFPPCLAGRPIRGPAGLSCFAAQSLADGVRLSSSFATDQISNGVKSLSDGLRPQQALLVVGSTPLSPADQELSHILQRQRFAVEVATGNSVTSAQTKGKAVVVISESVDSDQVGSRLRDVETGVVCFEPSLFDDLGLTGQQWAKDYGDLVGETEVVITTNRHQITSAQGTTATVASKSTKLVWGRPTNGAMILAHFKSAPDKAALFALEKGESLVHGGTAKGRRVGGFAGRAAPLDLTDGGKNLIASSLDWASQDQMNINAYLVVGTHPLTPNDIAMADLLTTAGVRPKTLLADDIEQVQSAPRSLVVVSESVDSTSVQTKPLRDSRTPLLVMEPSLFDDLGMTGPQWMNDYGDAPSSSDVQIAAASSPFAGSLSGVVKVTSSPSKLVWGKPTPTASVVAHLLGSPERAALFHYSRNQPMFKMTAPARRVGFFMGRETASQLSGSGIRLFQNTVRLSMEPEPSAALLVVGDKTLTTSDTALSQRLTTLSMTVSVASDKELSASLLDTFDVVVVSESSSSSHLNEGLFFTKTGLVLLEVAAFDEIGLTNATWQVDQGDIDPSGAIDIVNSNSVLAGGFPAGTLQVASPPGKMVWGRPAASASIVATIGGTPGKALIFSFDTGADLQVGKAAGRRVAWFAGRDLPVVLNAAGWRLFDSAVLWAAQR